MKSSDFQELQVNNEKSKIVEGSARGSGVMLNSLQFAHLHTLSGRGKREREKIKPGQPTCTVKESGTRNALERS